MLPRKYITVNGVMKINPEYTAAKEKKGEPTTVASPSKALAIISTADEMMTASEVMEKDKTIKKPIEMSDSNSSSTEMIQDPEFLAKFKTAKPIDGGDLLDKLYANLAKYEVPIGLINKLLILAEYKLQFIIDDSGSMTFDSDVSFKEASYIQKGNKSAEAKMTRWQEAEDRLHILIDLIGFIPTNGIVIQYLNKNDLNNKKKPSLTLSQLGKSPEEFIADAHKQISQFFSIFPNQKTPILAALTDALSETKESTMHYLFTDGDPSDSTTAQVASLITNRHNPKMNPITLISCSNEDTKWMKEVEETAPFVSELDDFNSERKEVLNDQGPVFPYSKGMWLMCNLIAAVCPNDLDAIDESIPFTKLTLDNILGRKLNEHEYKDYFINNPNAKKFNAIYSQFASEALEAHVIIGLIKKVTGIKEATDITEKEVKIYAATLSKVASLPAQDFTAGAPPSYQESMKGYTPFSPALFAAGAAAPQSRSGASEFKVMNLNS